jgi:hypothetical protein
MPHTLPNLVLLWSALFAMIAGNPCYARQSVSQLRNSEVESLEYTGESENAATPPSAEPENGSSESHLHGEIVETGDLDWLESVRVGYDDGFVICSEQQNELGCNNAPFNLKLNGWGQLRHSVFDSEGETPDENQFQLKRARLIFSGHAFTNDFRYFVQLDGRSSSGDDVRLLDYYLEYDVGRHFLGLDRDKLGFRTGKYKMPFTMARYLSGRQFEFADRSVASTFFDVNRSLAWGLYGMTKPRGRPFDWEIAIFNGLVTGGAETGSSGALDDNFAYSGRFFWYPTGEWGRGELADFDYHEQLAIRTGAAFATSTINRLGTTEFDTVRVVDSGRRLSNLLPDDVFEYSVYLYSLDTSMKYRGWSFSLEYYFRSIAGFQGTAVPDLSDTGFWLQFGKFVIPEKCQLLARWSRVVGDSGTIGNELQSADELAGGFVWYFREQHAKLTVDLTKLDGAPINSSALGISPGDSGWLFRSQIQFSF